MDTGSGPNGLTPPSAARVVLFATKPTLCGRRATLRPFTPEYITAMTGILIVDYAFGSTNLNRVGLEVYAFNPRARHVYQGAGFVLEGTKRAALKYDGAYVDAEVMSILRSDWLLPRPTAASPPSEG
jgi:RimJ/RimL family protein N-acetyltransferase